MTASPRLWSVPIVRVASVATVAFTVVQVAATIAPRGAPGAVAVVWSLAMFAVGCGAFGWAFLVAARRSRDERIDLAGVVWLIGVAPPAIARTLRMVLFVQVMVAVVTAAVRPFSAVAFGILVPMFGLGCLALYGARHGVFSRPGEGPGATAVAPPRSRSDTSEVTEGTAQRRTTSEPPVAADESATSGSEGDPTADPDDFDQLFRKRRHRHR